MTSPFKIVRTRVSSTEPFSLPMPPNLGGGGGREGGSNRDSVASQISSSNRDSLSSSFSGTQSQLSSLGGRDRSGSLTPRDTPRDRSGSLASPTPPSQ